MDDIVGCAAVDSSSSIESKVVVPVVTVCVTRNQVSQFTDITSVGKGHLIPVAVWYFDKTDEQRVGPSLSGRNLNTCSAISTHSCEQNGNGEGDGEALEVEVLEVVSRKR